jgi:hypothetical protein
MPLPPSVAFLSDQNRKLRLPSSRPLITSRLGSSYAWRRSPSVLYPVSFELYRFSYFQRKLTIPQAFFDWISIYRRVHTRRIASYRRLPMLTYPPEMNGTAAQATVRDRTNRYNILHEICYCHGPTLPCGHGLPQTHAFAAFARNFIQPELILHPQSTYPLVSSCLEPSPACRRFPFALCLVSFELHCFSYFQRKLTVP